MSAVAQKIREYYAENHTDYTEEKKLFLEGLRERGVVQGGLDRAGISRATAYMWRQLDPEFRLAWDEAKETCHDNVRQSMYEMAASGKNVVAGIFYLKHNCPEYRERVTIDVNMVQREVEEKMSELSLRHQLPATSLKDLVYEACGIQRGSQSASSNASSSNNQAVEVELPHRGNESSSSDSPT